MTWRRAIALRHFGPDIVAGRDIAGREIALYRLDDGYFATDNRCPHQWAFLSQGRIADGHVVCPLHGAAFDIRTGQPGPGVCRKPLRVYPVRVEDDVLFVRIDDTAPAVGSDRA